MPTFEIGEKDFLLDDKPHRVISGAMHYFRVHPDLWEDRVRKAKLMGLNTIETYTAWNEHFPTESEFVSSGRSDLARFLDIVADNGMHAFVRPGPFICAEWDGGGLPGWLLSKPGVGVRRSEPIFMAAVQQYFDHIIPIIAERQIDRGGPVILVQVENEYGSYGTDKAYLASIESMLRERGIVVPLTTVDEPHERNLANGTLPGVLATGSFGSRSTERLATLREHQASGPLMCTEFWCGWFDHWGAHHHITDADEAARDLDELLATGASVNIYMFHGGTNFGFTNGANDKGSFQPTVTSYDYDSPLAEDGYPNAKFEAFRNVIAKYVEVSHNDLPIRPLAPEFTIGNRRTAPLRDLVEEQGRWESKEHLPTHDELDAFRGFVWYRCELEAADTPLVLSFTDVRDRAQVFLGGQSVGVIDRSEGGRQISLPSHDSATLDILVEDQGRVNYDHRIGEAKGLIGPAILHHLAGNQTILKNWQATPLDLDDILTGQFFQDTATHSTSAMAAPSINSWEVPGIDAVDLYLSTDGWGKGVAWFNGWNLGRYWSKGPQRTLYVPSPLVQQSGNRVDVLELTGSTHSELRFVSRPNLGHTDF